VTIAVAGDALYVVLPTGHRCLSSAVLGGGPGRIRSWLNLQVAPDYARTDPQAHLAEVAASLPGPVVGMLTAADVRRHTVARRGGAFAVATVGIGQPLAAAGTRPRMVARVGTINLLVVVEAALTGAGLVGAVQTAVEAKAQALADAGIRAVNATGFATGTATDSVCVAAPAGGTTRFAGPATVVGAQLAQAVHAAVVQGAVAARERRPHRAEPRCDV
jgi:adenosylcobinamide hydrolase